MLSARDRMGHLGIKWDEPRGRGRGYRLRVQAEGRKLAADAGNKGFTADAR